MAVRLQACPRGCQTAHEQSQQDDGNRCLQQDRAGPWPGGSCLLLSSGVVHGAVSVVHHVTDWLALSVKAIRGESIAYTNDATRMLISRITTGHATVWAKRDT